MNSIFEAADDDALSRFLDFLADDISRHPEHLQALDSVLAQRIEALEVDIEIDLNGHLAGNGRTRSHHLFPSVAVPFQLLQIHPNEPASGFSTACRGLAQRSEAVRGR